MKHKIELYNCWPRPNDKRFWIQYNETEKTKNSFIIELSEEKLEEVKVATLDKVHQILNLELYNQFWIAYGEKPKKD